MATAVAVAALVKAVIMVISSYAVSTGAIMVAAGQYWLD